jgi:hypothetical protein
MLFWLLGLLLFSVRGIWEWLAPLSPSDFKGLIYLRDATLMPAALCWYVAILRWGTPRPLVQLWSFLRTSTQWMLDRPKWSVALLAIGMVSACVTITVVVMRLPNVLDETAYLFQAKVFASGRLWADPPKVSGDFFRLVFVVMTPDKWYGSFFPGQSIALLPGVLLGVPFLINPFLTGVLLVVTVWAGRRLFDEPTGLLGGALMLVSPFALLQGASYFSHIITAILFLPPVVWVLTSRLPSVNKPMGIGLCIGAILLCRPLSGVLLSVFLIGFLAQHMVANPHDIGKIWRQIVSMAVGVFPGLGLFLIYDRLLTGNAFVTPHQVALPNELLGIGIYSIENTLINLTGLSVDLLGVPLFSLAPIVVFASFGDRKQLMPMGILVLIYILGHGLYPYHGLSYGPRFYFELLPLLLIVSSRGLLMLPSLLSRYFAFTTNWSSQCVYGLCLASIVISLFGVLPPRLWDFHKRGEFYDIRQLIEQSTAKPAVVFISDPDAARLTPYMAGFNINDVNLEGPIIFARDLHERNPEILAAYPGRHAYKVSLENRSVVAYSGERTNQR